MFRICLTDALALRYVNIYWSFSLKTNTNILPKSRLKLLCSACVFSSYISPWIFFMNFDPASLETCSSKYSYFFYSLNIINFMFFNQLNSNLLFYKIKLVIRFYKINLTSQKLLLCSRIFDQSQVLALKKILRWHDIIFIH